MGRMKKLTLTFVMVFVVNVQLVFPQASISTSELRGQVNDQNGAAVAGATITATDKSRGATRTTCKSTITPSEGAPASLIITFADFLPMPGNSVSASWVRGMLVSFFIF